MKKALSLLLVGAMTLSLAACGGNGDSASTDSAAEESTTTEETEAADSEGGEAFKIGGIGPITGGTAIYGTAVQNGIQIAVDEINAAGGINGYQIDYNFQDDEGDSEKAINE